MNGCRRPDCTGTYAADGYCDKCGHKAQATTGSAPNQGHSASLGGPSLGGPSLGGHTSGRTRGRGGLGADLVVVAPVPLRDPATAILGDPQVPETARYCSRCGEPVGRGREGRPGRTEGFCPNDRTPFSFVPSLHAGDVVDGRYDILGALAHGGLGWIYLARDRKVSEAGADRWVVLKGLINTGDPDALAAAVAERRFLVAVDHPNIVKIYDFAQHTDPATGETAGYIVMEYVGGSSLKELVLAGTGPLPLPQVLAYGLEVLPALGYLHERGLLFCDFKPDNVIHAEEQLKLIDLGAVRGMGDDVSALYGTPGYQAPELATTGASIGSDLYTVGRTLAVLSFDFGGFSTRYADRLPDPGDVPLLAREESYHRFLRRATDSEPHRRFTSAADMAEQLTGVLREVLAAADGVPRPSGSARFTGERASFGTTGSAPGGAEVVAALPVPLSDPADPAAGFLAALTTADAPAAVAALRAAPVRSVEVRLQLARALLATGDPAAATQQLQAAQLTHTDWRHDWHAGLIALAAGRFGEARTHLDAVYDALPGEPAARLALAAACELSGDTAGAARRYERVWRVDHAFVSAAFGLSRMRLDGGDRAGAVRILDEVPDTSSRYVAAQVAAVRAAVDPRPGPLTETDFVEASQRLERLRLDGRRQAMLAVEMFSGALRWLNGAPMPVTGLPGQLLGQGLSERELRTGLERTYRVLATLEPDRKARHALVDQANAVRPWTLW
ncbi:tetratricopeptide repeat protein [Dactylosporangium sp. AC04546]|uniref:serine/threonine-protein kinase n=1 Tax=Dactylosporangium sp. AC04546 TaxID=2862460 RepID=UPI001EDCD440|nr:serine/threonine-protein kinase [Dactylosporangium sp. AC04546]WVK78841.1 tetratricopeptide repeat protein [Dactylosporangium sp. AC04546]